MLLSDFTQVASHVQKYFIKLAKAGLPVPGRVPNLAVYGPKSKKVYLMVTYNNIHYVLCNCSATRILSETEN